MNQTFNDLTATGFLLALGGVHITPGEMAGCDTVEDLKVVAIKKGFDPAVALERAQRKAVEQPGLFTHYFASPEDGDDAYYDFDIQA